ncbi:hypothetical protein [Cohnella cellulosilytica]|uniref:DUF2157 domain-containing protein n=1 Tax=Cohnella cellulosilytica TaxID=986710 RepID=A0ABW2FB46_9BACL
MAANEEEKRNLIVKEIESWRRSKLLPEQYCDFLQNIYLEDLEDRPRGITGAAMKKISQASGKQWFLASGIFALICFVVLHFSAFPLLLQIAIALLVAGGFVFAGVKQRESRPARGYAWIGAGIVFLFGSGLAIVGLRWGLGGSALLWLLGLLAVVWLGGGLWLRLALPQWLGWLAAIALYALLLAEHAPAASVFEVQIFWIPAALLFLWLSWFMHVRLASAGTAMFAAALVLWFMPEIYSALYGVRPEWIQTEILIKILIAGIGMFRLRKQWMEWVA